jgi:transposase
MWWNALSTGVPTGSKRFRAIATRFEKRAVNYRAMVVIASILLWLGM